MSTTIMAKSGRAARREMARLRAARLAGPQLLPDHLKEWLSGYRPVDDNIDWQAVGPFVTDTLRRSNIRGDRSVRVHATDLTYFAAWSLGHGLTLGPAVLTRANVDEYCRVGMGGRIKDRRARLRGLADSINPHQAPVKTLRVPRDPLKPPYTPGEMATIRRVIYVQTETLTRQLCVCVGLGAGAGLDSADLRELRTQHVTDLGDDGIFVRVPGRNPRTVWVLREYETVVRDGLTGLPPGHLLLGKNPGRRNITTPIYERAVLVGSVPHLEQSRLRTTWLATQLQRPVSFASLCAAAGLKSTRTLFDILPFIEQLHPAEGPVVGGDLR